MFSHLFGIHPWDVERLTVEQFDGYVAFAESMRQRGE
jgi:hypothetical protein